jgi:hypothetical protein
MREDLNFPLTAAHRLERGLPRACRSVALPPLLRVQPIQPNLNYEHTRPGQALSKSFQNSLPKLSMD